MTCNGNLVFLDLDNAGGVLFTYNTAAKTWAKQTLTQATCSSGANLWPRDQGYVLTVTNNAGTSNQDRLVALGGSPDDTNVFTSGDCGVTWVCNTGQQAWVPRHYSALVPTKGIFPGDPLIMAGGISTGITVAQFHSTDGGLTWQRPACASASPCQQACMASSDGSLCTLPVGTPDDYGSCSATNPNYNLCMCHTAQTRPPPTTTTHPLTLAPYPASFANCTPYPNPAQATRCRTCLSTRAACRRKYPFPQGGVSPPPPPSSHLLPHSHTSSQPTPPHPTSSHLTSSHPTPSSSFQ